MATPSDVGTPPSAPTKNAVGKALELLFSVGELSAGGPVRIATLQKKSGFTRPTIHRHLNTLIANHLVEHTDAGYLLGSGVLALAANLRGHLSIRGRALPILRDLAAETGYTVHLGVRNADKVIYVEKIENRHPIRLASTIGQAAAMHSAGLGKAILAWSEPPFVERYIASGLERRTAHTITDGDQLRVELTHIRTAGYAVDAEENEAGVQCVAAPILDHDGEIIASLSVSGTVQQLPFEATAAVSVTVIRHAQQVSELMGYTTPQQSA